MSLIHKNLARFYDDKPKLREALIPVAYGAAVAVPTMEGLRNNGVILVSPSPKRDSFGFTKESPKELSLMAVFILAAACIQKLLTKSKENSSEGSLPDDTDKDNPYKPPRF